MAYDIIIANGLVVSSTETHAADVGIVGDKITAVAPDLPRSGAGRVVDAAGKYVLPGGIDVHTHLDMPLTADISSSDDFETGTRAAAFGGTTTIIDFATQSPGETLHRAVETWKKKAAGRAVIDYGFHCVICDYSDAVLDEMDELVAEGITSFKVFMAYPGRLMLDDAAIFKVLQRSMRKGSLICVHAENGGAIDVLVRQALALGYTAPRYHAVTRPPAAEAEATNRAIALAEMAGAPVYIVHVSCQGALEHVADARAQSLPVFAETCPHYLYLCKEQLDAAGCEGAKYVLTPPLRASCNHEHLWQGLRRGTLQVVSTDHCPFNYQGQKDRGRDDFTRIPNGGPGIEHRLSLVFSGGVAAGWFNENRFVDLVSTSPAKLFGLYPRKGIIAVDSDADVVVFDPGREHTISAQNHHMRVDYSMYEGVRVKGMPEVVVARGRIIVKDNAFHGRAGDGEFLVRKPFDLRAL
jgi:dihydropyrimidinase